MQTENLDQQTRQQTNQTLYDVVFSQYVLCTVVSDSSLLLWLLKLLILLMSIPPNNNGEQGVQQWCIFRLHTPSCTFISIRCHAVQLRRWTFNARNTTAGQRFHFSSNTPEKALLLTFI